MEPIRSRLQARRALLWVCQRHDLTAGEIPHDNSASPADATLKYRSTPTETDKALAAFHWEAVWLQGALSPILPVLRSEATKSGRTLAILASEADSATRALSDDILGVHVLPGLLSEHTGEGAYGSTKARKRDRIEADLGARLSMFPGRVLVVVGASQASDLERLFEVLEDNPIYDLNVVIAWSTARLPVPPDNTAIQVSFVDQTTAALPDWLREQGLPRASKPNELQIRLGKTTAELSNRDLGAVSPRYKLLLDNDLRTPSTLTTSDLSDFLAGRLDNIKCFAAGLPSPRAFRTETGQTLTETLLAHAERLRADRELRYSCIYLPSEAGAGATTLIRAAALELAKTGLPVLILRPDCVDIDSEELLAFSAALNAAARAGNIPSQPLVLVADVEHSAIALERAVRAS